MPITLEGVSTDKASRHLEMLCNGAEISTGTENDLGSTHAGHFQDGSRSTFLHSLVVISHQNTTVFLSFLKKDIVFELSTDLEEYPSLTDTKISITSHSDPILFLKMVSYIN